MYLMEKHCSQRYCRQEYCRKWILIQDTENTFCLGIFVIRIVIAISKWGILFFYDFVFFIIFFSVMHKKI